MTKKEEPSNKCPKCGFAGDEQFPKGYAKENFPKIKIIKKDDKDWQEVERDDNNNSILIQISRCPKCGYREEKING